MKNYYYWIIILTILVLMPILIGYSDYYLFVLAIAYVFAVLAVGWDVLAYCGQISLGHAALFGIGAYVSALISMNGISPWLTIFLGALSAVLISNIIGLTCLRLKAAYFTIATLAFAVVVKVIVDNLEITGGSGGIIGIPCLSTDITTSYYVSLVFLVVSVFIFHRIIRSKMGLAFSAIRDDEISAQALGVDVFRYRLYALWISAFISGLSGAMYAHLIYHIYPSTILTIYISALPLIMALFGGRLHAIGPAFGAITLYLTNKLILHPIFPRTHGLVYGPILVVVILLMPEGIIGKLASYMKYRGWVKF